MVGEAVCPSCLPSLGKVGNKWTASSSSLKPQETGGGGFSESAILKTPRY